ncbi:hypothetical protein AB0I28_33810 [Phytomonospora sp. NPDC050363]|uniref:hypothetical protein n=1 Tax=Phytomonospora sp. NPDC050363 TaxID=3155642 RepID=UPI0033FF14E3
MTGIQFSDEALSAFQTTVRQQLDLVEDTIIAKLKGDLALEPAFGKFPQAVQAAEKYKTNFGSAWTDVQGLRNALKAIDEACTQTLKNYGKTEEDNTAK